MTNSSLVPEVELTKSALFAEAEERTGFTDWGNTSVFEPALDQLLSALENEACLSRVGRFGSWMGIAGRLQQRLMLQRDGYDRVPTQIADKPALVIAGPHRTGTTLLQRLLSLDPATDALRYCDVASPAPATRPGTTEDEAKIEGVSVGLARLQELLPDLIKIHEIEPRTPDEEVFLMNHAFVCILEPVRARVPSYWNWILKSADLPALYRELKHLIAYAGQYRTGSQWVLKGPQHLWMLRHLLDGFPNAHVIWTHRDPAKSVPSMCSLSRVVRKLNSDSVRDEEVGADWLEMVADGLARAMKDRDERPDRPILDVTYRDLMRDPEAVIRGIYEAVGLDYPARMSTAVQSYLRGNPKGKHGSHSYTAEEFGLSAGDIRERFTAYIERYRVPIEDN